MTSSNSFRKYHCEICGETTLNQDLQGSARRSDVFSRRRHGDTDRLKQKDGQSQLFEVRNQKKISGSGVRTSLAPHPNWQISRG